MRTLHRAEAEGRTELRLSELSERLLIRPPSVTTLIDRMERAALVSRVPSSIDLRVREIQLTTVGRELVLRVLSVHEDRLIAVLAGLAAADQVELSRLLSVWGGHLQRLIAEETSVTARRGNGSKSRKETVNGKNPHVRRSQAARHV